MSDRRQEQTLRILEALSGVDEELLERCDTSGKGEPERRRYRRILRYGSLCAACLCALLTAAVLRDDLLWKNGRSGGQEAPRENSVAAPMERPETAEADGESVSGETFGDGEPVWIVLAELPEGKTAEYGKEQQKAEASVENMSEENVSDGVTPDNESKENLGAQKKEMPENWQEACLQSALGQYVPRELPEGYDRQQALRRILADGSENLLLRCGDGEHMLWLNLTATELDPQAEYACVPPIFGAAGDWQEKLPEPGGDGSRRFAVLYEDGVLAEYAGWLTEEEIRELFRQIPDPEEAGQ